MRILEWVIPVIIAVLYLEQVDPQLFTYTRARISNILFCNNLFIKDDLDDYLHDLRKMVFGQPFVISLLIPKLLNHYSIDKPKPLVVGFHGPVGVGKTLVADHLFKTGIFKNKRFLETAKLTNNKHHDSVKKYLDELKLEIEITLRNCRRSLFVFDSVDGISKELFEQLPPFSASDDIDYSGSMFIYVSQEYSDEIISATSNLNKLGINRFSFDYGTFLKYMETGGGLWGSLMSLFRNISSFRTTNTAKKNVEELFIPFLPLVPEHVQVCIEKELKELNYEKSKSEININEILHSVGCPPESEFCSVGCKLVPTNVAITLNTHDEF